MVQRGQIPIQNGEGALLLQPRRRVTIHRDPRSLSDQQQNGLDIRSRLDTGCHTLQIRTLTCPHRVEQTMQTINGTRLHTSNTMVAMDQRKGIRRMTNWIHTSGILTEATAPCFARDIMTRSTKRITDSTMVSSTHHNRVAVLPIMHNREEELMQVPPLGVHPPAMLIRRLLLLLLLMVTHQWGILQLPGMGHMRDIRQLTVIHHQPTAHLRTWVMCLHLDILRMAHRTI